MSSDSKYHDELDAIGAEFFELIEKVRSGKFQLEVDRSDKMTAAVYEFLQELVGTKAMYLPEDSTTGEFIHDRAKHERARKALAGYGIWMDEQVLNMPVWQLHALATVDTEAVQ